MALGSYTNLRVDRHDRVYVITMHKAPENRLNVRFAQEIIRALRDIEQELGPDSEGCVITRGNDEKFWCTGLELDESDTNPHANSDGFFPVRAADTNSHDLLLTSASCLLHFSITHFPQLLSSPATPLVALVHLPLHTIIAS